jgi:hypothetical protein
VSNPKKTKGLLSNDKKGFVFPHTNRYDKKGLIFHFSLKTLKGFKIPPSPKTLTPHPFPSLPSTTKSCVKKNQRAFGRLIFPPPFPPPIELSKIDFKSLRFVIFQTPLQRKNNMKKEVDLPCPK